VLLLPFVVREEIDDGKLAGAREFDGVVRTYLRGSTSTMDWAAWRV
jgi:hypothetical protein